MNSPMFELSNLMGFMFSAGLLDNAFNRLQQLQESSSNPGMVSELVKKFCEDGEQTIRELANLLNEQVVDYHQVTISAYNIKGRSSSFGARRVANASIELCEFCKEKNKLGCLMTLESIKNEFYDLRDKLHTMVQLEKRVEAYFPRK
ncbi:histidine-containing phosphotransfer protein 2 [Brachypodium distachyon]|uniref:Histidine-containing phosphotransfer protein n=1 Tax=Brachypodium distachyon TaxID=15368 RepID=I1HMS4_BRADI|nr:histidine-containing phosphotransfer protein 2 [Brachypodium distachyon]KQK07958.1 hypothetical protein BRADI_2g38610v3 [Brachypodium distachyon]|eukprot:XP_010233388.1 histidine-containing phosphotransfer protein 2 [Brachypodium distachyon]